MEYAMEAFASDGWKVVRTRRTDRVPVVPQSAGSPAAGGRKQNPYTIEVLRRAIEVLSVFSHARPAMSLAEIVQAVRLPKTTVFRVRSSLVERRLVEWGAAGRRLSTRVGRL